MYIQLNKNYERIKIDKFYYYELLYDVIQTIVLCQYDCNKKSGGLVIVFIHVFIY